MYTEEISCHRQQKSSNKYFVMFFFKAHVLLAKLYHWVSMVSLENKMLYRHFSFLTIYPSVLVFKKIATDVLNQDWYFDLNSIFIFIWK